MYHLCRKRCADLSVLASHTSLLQRRDRLGNRHVSSPSLRHALSSSRCCCRRHCPMKMNEPVLDSAAVSMWSIPPETIQHAMSFLNHVELCRMSCVCKAFCNVSDDEQSGWDNGDPDPNPNSTDCGLIRDDLHWKPLCLSQFVHMPRYQFHLEERAKKCQQKENGQNESGGGSDDDSQQSVGSFEPIVSTYSWTSWKEAFRWTDTDSNRTVLLNDELQQLAWYFNFTPKAGGRGRDTLLKGRFAGTRLLLPEYPPLRSYLVTDQSSAKQFLVISNFPWHEIERLPNGEWLITNPNVTLVSSYRGVEPDYDERGFLTMHPNSAERRAWAARMPRP